MEDDSIWCEFIAYVNTKCNGEVICRKDFPNISNTVDNYRKMLCLIGFLMMLGQ